MAGLLDFLRPGGGGAVLDMPNDPGNVNTAFQNFAQGTRGGLLSAIGNAVTGLQTGQRTDPVGMAQQLQEMTYNAFLQSGVPKAQAALAATNPAAQKLVLDRLFPTYDFKTAGDQGIAFSPSLGTGTPLVINPKAPTTVGPGEVPVVTMPQFPGYQGGGLGAPQAAPASIARQPLAPPVGAPGPAPLGQGGATALAPGVTMGGTPMTIQEKEAQTEAGKVQGQTAAKIPTLQQNTQQAISIIDQLKNHPGRQGFFAPTGFKGKFDPIPGTEGYNFVTMLDQAKSGIFRVAIQDMRGLGSLSNVEGSKVEAALGRLDRAQTPDAFNQALNELKNYYQLSFQNAQRIARGDMRPYPVAEQPQQAPSQQQPQFSPPPIGAINALRANPGRAKEFDAKFGPGAAEKILGAT